MFYWRSTFTSGPGAAPVELGFTGRSAGRGSGAYAGLNLGGHVGDDAADVEANRKALAHAVDLPRERIVFMNQVHGCDVVEVAGPWDGEAPAVDAVVTRERDLALAVLVADCVSVLLHDADGSVLGAVHAGRPGMVDGIIGRAVSAMRDLGATRVHATVGPSVCGRCYEVPDEMATAAVSAARSAAARSWTGTPAIDVAAGVVEQLAAADVTVQWVPGCTRESGDLYSYRRDGRTGRFAGLVLRRAVAP
ncbi:polyphenol oxidase family protein [Terrabacter sp. BE26]|uniref:polyphenol oxidase family protein n=1 Tax=Terrabacter sp. BE26 TaxID=2898152 RepID=UPI0035BE7970